MTGLLARARNRVLDATIVRSFDSSGYRRHAASFDPSDLEVDMKGRICAVTGANSGIGYATSRALAARGAEVWMLCRSPERGAAARDRLRAETGSDRLFLEQVDLSSMASIRALVGRLSTSVMDVLVHNAGVLPDERIQTSEGLELTLATNLVGPFLLSQLLHERLCRSSDARVIHVSSGGMYPRRLRCAVLGSGSGRFDGVTAYADTKRAMVVLNELLAERWASDGIAVHCMHPGWADTPAVQTSLPAFHRWTEGILRSPEEGADTVVWLAVTRGKLESGRFWFDRAAQPTHILPWTREPSAERERLWEELVAWSGLSERAGD